MTSLRGKHVLQMVWRHCAENLSLKKERVMTSPHGKPISFLKKWSCYHYTGNLSLLKEIVMSHDVTAWKTCLTSFFDLLSRQRDLRFWPNRWGFGVDASTGIWTQNPQLPFRQQQQHQRSHRLPWKCIHFLRPTISFSALNLRSDVSYASIMGWGNRTKHGQSLLLNYVYSFI